MDSEDMLFILYTSEPPASLRCGAYNRWLQSLYPYYNWIFDLQDTDVYWCTADVGWITGHITSFMALFPMAQQR